ncbi:unnamed protein product [Durusdinium trenchii]|uniref:Uncharacterized protein n=1 Tax=Durusdinium trenchii TaxID=1381693 RepID=A0ABP0NZI1_9DINO
MLESVFFSPRSYDRRSMRWRPRVKLLSLRLPDDEEPQPAVGWGLAQEGGGKHFAFDQSQQLDSSSFLGPPNFVHPQVGWKPKLGQVFHQLRQVSAAAPRPNSDTRRDGSQTEQPWGLEGGLAPSRPVSRSLRASQRTANASALLVQRQAPRLSGYTRDELRIAELESHGQLSQAARAVCPARLVRHARYASEDTRPRTRAQRARAEPERAEVGQARLWDLMEKNAQIFHPKMLPKILVPAAALSPSEQQDVRLVQLLQRAMKYLERDGPLVPVVGAKGACSIVKASRQLHTPEARSFSLKWLGVMCAQAPSLDASLLAELAQELLRFKILDEEIWEALARTVCERCDGLGAAEVVPLLDAFKRSYTSSKVDRAIVALCRSESGTPWGQRATDCCEEFSQRQCVVAVASLCRLSRAVPATLLDQVIHRLLETWLARVDAFSRQTNVNQVISLAISLTALPTNSPVRARQLAGARGALPTGSVEIFQHRLAGWAHDCGAPGVGVLSPEELILVLWALKDLTPTGLSEYQELVGTCLLRIQSDTNFEGWSLARQVQALEVLLASKHARVAGSSADEVPSEALAKEIEARLVATMTQQLAEAPCRLVGKVLVIGEQGGQEFWPRCASLTEAVLRRAVDLAHDPAVKPDELQPVLDTVASSALTRIPAFRAGCEALRTAAAQRPDAPSLASVLMLLQKATAPSEPQPEEEAEEVETKMGAASGGFDEERPLSPLELAERLGRLGKAKKANPTELSMVADRFLATVESLSKDELLPALSNVLLAGRWRIQREALLLEVVERLGDQVAMRSPELTSLQLVSAVDVFADMGLPYHLVFEAALLELLQKKQPLTWQQAIVVLEAFAAVQIRIPELARIYQRFQRQQELARLPTMGMVRFLAAATQLELTENRDVKEMTCRILAETSPERPLPVVDTVSLIESLWLSGSVLQDMQLRHLLSWVATLRPRELSEQNLTTLRNYILFILAQEDGSARLSLQRMPVEIQTRLSELLCHPSPCWTRTPSEETRLLRSEVSELLLEKAPSHVAALPAVSLGPAGQADLEVNHVGWLLDGPEAFFRPFTPLRYTPQEKQRAWLLETLLRRDDMRQAVVADFFPKARQWPTLPRLQRLNWLEWGQASSVAAKKRLLGVDEGWFSAAAKEGQRSQEATAS